MAFVKILAVLVVGAAVLGGAPAFAADLVPEPAKAEAPRHTFDQAKALVDEGVAHIKAVGPDKAFADFNDPAGKWIRGELYLFAFDKKGVYRATGYRPERTGQNAWEMTDAAGLKVVQEIVKKAKRDGTATVDYLWKNPTTGKLENKTSYVVQVGDHVVGAGFYHK
ncbi:conserved exported hypothetical protein [Magnetospirillum sp. LM-5]|uniref:cache domain-containing protein n=1 Tax=Magnetospirillum sp. LM-5 TaxID=2681466 RepID=UPI001381DCE6|nr:cache domain-containing protein [Magnetospirillum sp. LM-5]CAA7624805.1 conserved exported hypothetical protein [Magnetospirillum sp. LM-5]